MDMKKRSRVFSDDDPLSMLRRSMLYACGWTHEEIKRPFVAVVNTYNEMHPGHMHLKTLAEWVKAGMRTAGGLPTEFFTLSLCDGLETAMKAASQDTAKDLPLATSPRKQPKEERLPWFKMGIESRSTSRTGNSS